jgi:hypothetical protein
MLPPLDDERLLVLTVPNKTSVNGGDVQTYILLPPEFLYLYTTVYKPKLRGIYLIYGRIIARHNRGGLLGVAEAQTSVFTSKRD